MLINETIIKNYNNVYDPSILFVFIKVYKLVILNPQATLLVP